MRRSIGSTGCADASAGYIYVVKGGDFKELRMLNRTWTRCAAIGSLLFWSLLTCVAAGLGPRTGNTTLNLPLTGTPYPYSVENAFGDVQFTLPLAVVTAPGENNRVFVVEQGGTIVVIPNLANPTRGTFLDISDRVADGNPSEEGGILGLAFHPNFSANGYFFVYYICNTTTSLGSGRHDRLSRFARS